MLDGLKKNIADLQAFNWGNELENIVDTNKDALLQLQEQQMYEGKDSKGEPITLDGGGYAETTIRWKKEKGQPTDRVTLKDTGDLYNSLQATVDEKTFSMKGDTPYEKELIERTGEQVYGLDEDSRQQFADNVTLPAIKSIFKEKTGFVIE